MESSLTLLQKYPVSLQAIQQNRLPVCRHDDRLLLGQNVYCLDTMDVIEHFDHQIHSYLLLESRSGVHGETLLTGEEEGVIGFWVFDSYTAKYVRTQELVVSPTAQNFGYGTEITHLVKVDGVLEEHRLESGTL